MGILLCEQNFRNVWIRNESVRAEIGQILHTSTHPHTHTHTHTHTTAAKFVVRICLRPGINLVFSVSLVRACFFKITSQSYRSPQCSNGPVFVFMCKTLRLCAIYSVILPSIYGEMLSSHIFLCRHSFLVLCTCIVIILFLLSPPLLSLTRGHIIAVVFLTEVHITGSILASIQLSSFFTWSFFVVTLAYFSTLISVVCSSWIPFLNCIVFRLMYHCCIYYGFVDLIFDIDRHLLITHDSWHIAPFSPCSLHYIVHIVI